MYTWIMVNQLFFQFKKKQLNSIEQKKKKRKLTDIRLFKKELSNWNTDRWMLDLGNPLQCSCLENPRDGGVGWAAVYGVAQSQTRLKRLSSSSILAWRIPWTEEPGGLQFIDLQRVRQDWVSNIFTFRIVLRRVDKIRFALWEMCCLENEWENHPGRGQI